MSLINYDSYKKINEELTPEEIEERKRAALATHMKMYISKDLADILKTMENPIAKDLLTLSRRDIRFDITYMDISNEPGKVTYLQTIKIKKMKDDGLDLSKARRNYNSEVWTSPQRVQPAKIGKVMTKIFMDGIFKGKYSKVDIEKFGNEYKAKCEDSDDKMKVVYGRDINKWYLEENYGEGGGNLSTSCMRYRNRNSLMDLYSFNKPVNNEGDVSKFKPLENQKSQPPYISYVGMLILLDDNDKLLGRSIVWFNSIKPDKPSRTFMDRIYTLHDHDIDKFKDYAKKRGWLYKKKQTYGDPTYIDPKDNSTHTMTLSFRIINKEYNKYPYMDTLKYYTPSTGRISSAPPKRKIGTVYKCESQYGDPQRI